MFTEPPVLATDYSYPELRRLSFAQYSENCELKAERSLELVQLVSLTFDGQYYLEMIYAILRRLNPPVFLIDLLEEGGQIRLNWPCLSDATLDLVDERCRYFLGQGLLAHERAVAELLAQALTPLAAKPVAVRKPGDQLNAAGN